MIQNLTVFIDKYTGDGYGKNNEAVMDTIKEVMIRYGIPLDSTYTRKAFFGMNQYLRDNHIEGKKILFIHTGGTPFFDDLKNLER